MFAEPASSGGKVAVVIRPASASLAALGSRRCLPESLVSQAARIARFDQDTLFFDVFRAAEAVVCLGPPLQPLEPALPPLRFEAGDATGPIDAAVRPSRVRQQLATRILLSGPGLDRAEAIDVVAGDRRARLAISPSGAALFAGRRVLVTLSKDNPLVWIRDWVRFHVRVQGADAVLLYDNGSGAYGLDDLAAVLGEVEGIRQAVVVDWRFPYGIGGGPGRPVEDNYCQTGMLDHARRRFLPLARSVLGCDVDELVVGAAPSIFQRLEESRFAALEFRGIWVERPGVTDPQVARALRHGDCHYADRAQIAAAPGDAEPLCRPKWVAVPARCGDDLEWGVHGVYGATPATLAAAADWRGRPRDVRYRHFRQICTGWKIDRWRSEPLSPARHHLDVELVAAMAMAFGEPAAEAPRGGGAIALDFVVVCMQRSGSHMLGAALGRHPDLAFHGEYGAFRQRGQPFAPRPGRLDFMVVMYNQVEAAAGDGIDLETLPVVHLTRDHRDLAVSNICLAKSRAERGSAHRAHFRTAAEVPSQLQYAPTEAEIAPWLRRIAALERGASARIGANPRVLVIDYADLTGSQDVRRIAPAAAQRLCEFLGIAPVELPVSIVKSRLTGNG